MTIKQQGGIFGRNPTFNTATVDNDFRVNGDLGIGQDASFPLDILGSSFVGIHYTRTGTSSPAIRLSNATTGSLVQIEGNNSGELIFKNGAGSLSESGRFNSSGNLAFPSGQGIDFSATSGTGTSELFSDYEEGTWTPVPSDATSGGNAGTGTISGLYTKVGNIVTAQFRIVNLDTTGMTAGNVLRIQGLPFISKSASGSFAGSLDVQNVTFADGISMVNTSGQSYLTIRELSSGGSGSNLTVSDFTSGSADVFGSITYTAA